MTGTRIEPASESSIAEAALRLAGGQLVGIPTETVYGLAADATNPSAVAKIFAAKGRPANNPLIIHVESTAAARRWVRVDQPGWLAEQWRLATTFWPGPLTVVVPHGGTVIDQVTAGAATVAIRVPDHPVLRSLLAACPFPLAAPSANRSNYVSPTRAEHVAEAFGEEVALVVDGGECRWGVESTIIRPDRAGVELLRPGGITAEQLLASFGTVSVLQTSVLQTSDHSRGTASEQGSTPMPAPGMLSKHYAPTKPLCRLDAWRPDRVDPARVARLAFAPLAEPESAAFGWYRALSRTGDLDEVAQNLFDAIRRADSSTCELIVIDQCDRSGIGRAIMDRIDRACG